MKLNLNKLTIVLTVAMLMSANVVEAKVANVVEAKVANAVKAKVSKKSIQECIRAAKCEETLKKELKDNGHVKIAETFKDVKCEDTAKKAINNLNFSDKIAVIQACMKEKEHLQKILPQAKK